MATVQLGDIVDVVVFRDIESENAPEKTKFFESGIIAQSPLLTELANASGKTAVMPFWLDLDDSEEPNYSNDNPADIAVPDKIEQAEQTSRKAFLNNGWSETDLASELVMGKKAMERIKERTDRYWARQFQKRLLATCSGIIADNIANHDSDMVFDASAATNADVDSGSIFTRSNFTSAVYTMGDMADGIQLMVVHSVIMKRMIDNGDIETIRDEDGNIILQSYLGKQIIVDDSMPYVPAGGTGGGDTAPKYTAALFGRGVFGYGNGTPKVPTAISRVEEQGNGGGVETLWERKTWLLHPFGYAVQGTPANGGQSFNLAELANPARYERLLHRKNIPLAFMIVSG